MSIVSPTLEVGHSHSGNHPRPLPTRAFFLDVRTGREMNKEFIFSPPQASPPPFSKTHSSSPHSLHCFPHTTLRKTASCTLPPRPSPASPDDPFKTTWRSLSARKDRIASFPSGKKEEKDEAVMDTTNRVSRQTHGFKHCLSLVILEEISRAKEQRALEKDLLAASATGKVATVTKLLQLATANPNCKTKYDMTPLHYAALYGSVEIVERLLRAGADPMIIDSRGKTPLSYAYAKGHKEIILILQAATSPGVPTSDPSLVISKLDTEGKGEGEGKGRDSESEREGEKRSETVEPGLYVQVSVSAGRVEGSFLTLYTNYNVTMTITSPATGRRSFMVKRRFSDFYNFYNTLMTCCPSIATRLKLRDLKPIKCTWHRFDREVVASRAALFQELLKEASNDAALLLHVVDFLNTV